MKGFCVFFVWFVKFLALLACICLLRNKVSFWCLAACVCWEVKNWYHYDTTVLVSILVQNCRPSGITGISQLKLQACPTVKLNRTVNRGKIFMFSKALFLLSNSVVLNLFYIFTLLSNKITRFTCNTQRCSIIENTKLTNSYSLEWFIKMYIGCNLCFSKFTTLENEICPRLRTTGLVWESSDNRAIIHIVGLWLGNLKSALDVGYLTWFKPATSVVLKLNSLGSLGEEICSRE